MIASEEVRDHPEHVIRAGGGDDIPVLKLGVIYGANASGKSNLVKAMLMARDMILDPQDVGSRIVRAPFKLDPACRDMPTRFEFEIQIDNRYFAYGFSVSAERVEEEWLFEVGRTIENRVFERNGGQFEWGDWLGLLDHEKVSFLKSNAKGTHSTRLFLTDCRERNLHDTVPEIADILAVIRWFEDGLIVTLPDWFYRSIPVRLQSDELFKQEMSRYLRCFDTGIETVDVEPMDPSSRELERTFPGSGYFSGLLAAQGTFDGSNEFTARDEQGVLRTWRLVSRHLGQTETEPRATFEMSEESDGTRRLMQLVPAMIAMMEGGGVFVIDELDRSLHADILHSYLANFLKYSTGRSSQLIVTTHDTTLLRQDFLRHDEVWFVEKGKDQSSRLVALEEYKDVDQSKDLQQDYLLGRFGGVPVIRDFSWLGEKHGETA